MFQMRALLCVSVLLFGVTARVYSQTTFASITGTVTDATGAPQMVYHGAKRGDRIVEAGGFKEDRAMAPWRTGIGSAP